MSLCQLKPQALHHFGGIASEKLAIVPDIQNYSLVSDSKRCRSEDSDCLSIGEGELELLSQDYQETKRHCGYSISPSPNQFQLVENTEVFITELKESYNFGAREDTNIFTCGGNSPASTSSSPAATDFNPTGRQGSADCSQPIINFQELVPDFFPDMQQPPQTVMSTHAEKYELVITEQPEEYYRARYNSEGVRAPLKGMTENYPTVQVYGQFRYGRIDVKLVHADGTSHTSCSLDTSEGRKNAVTKKIGPFNRMIAEFEDLRIRRVKKEGRKKSAGVEKPVPKDGRSDKVASLLFTATLDTEQGELVRSIQSRPISLTTAPEPAELDWLEPNRGHFAGQEPLVIKGSKMTSPKVTFRIVLPDGRRQELHGSVDKERSHQNVLLVKTPSLAQMAYQFSHQTIRAEVVVITGRNQMSSNALQFDFIPNHICRECMQETPRPAHMTANFSVCSPPAIPAYPAASTAASGGAGLSPPSTPGLTARQLSPSPSAQMPQPLPNRMHLAPPTQSSYSTQSIPSTPLSITTTDAIASPASAGSLLNPEIGNCSLPTPEVGPHHTHEGRSGDEIIGIMQDLMGQKQPSYHLYGNPQNSYSSQIEGNMQQAASPYIPVTSPSAASDQPCYSPVTPVQSPANSTPWNYIDQMLATLLRNEQINHQDYRFLAEECAKQNPILMQAFNNSQSNEGVFLQLLASYKPAEQAAYQATRQ